MAEPTSWAATNPEIQENRRESVEGLRGRVRERTIDRSEGLERGDRIRTADELIQFVEDHGVGGLRERRLEQKYGGTGLLGRWRRFMAGENNVTIDEGGNTRYYFWRDLGRRTLRTIFNRKTVIGGLALGVIGGLSGGLGAIGLPALYSFWGTMAGGAAAEGIGLASGAEQRARERLKRAEYDEAYEMEELAVRYHDEPDPAKRADIALKIVGHFHQAADTALGTVGTERQAAEKQLGEAQKKQDNLRKILQLTGTVAGVGYGFVDAGWHAASGAIDAGKGFGAVDADWNGIYHQVAQQNGHWHYLYNSVQESGAAHDAGARVVTALGKHGGHIILKDPNFAAKVYGWAGARALGVVGAMYAGGAVPGMAIDAGERERQKDWQEEQKASEARIRATIEAARPVAEEDSSGRIEIAFGTILRVAGLGEKLSGGVFPAYVMPAPGVTPGFVPQTWDPSWQYLRLMERTPADGKQPEHYRVELFTDVDSIRKGVKRISYQVAPETYALFYQTARELHPDKPLGREAQSELIKLEKDAGLKDAVGKTLSFRSGVKADDLRILQTPTSDPRPGNLDPKAKYEFVGYSTEAGTATVRNAKTGATELVGLAALWDRVAPARGGEKTVAPLVTGTPATPGLPAAPAVPGARVIEEPAARRSWKEVVDDLEIRGEPKPKVKDIWVIINPVDAQVASGSKKGDEETLEVGDRYLIRKADPKTGRVVMVPAAGGEPLELHIEDFDGNLRAEKSRIAELLGDKQARGEAIPRNEQISTNQRWRYQYTDPTGTTPDDAAPAEYRVDGFGRGGLIRLVNPAAPAGPTQLRLVSPLDLAEKGEFVP